MSCKNPASEQAVIIYLDPRSISLQGFDEPGLDFLEDRLSGLLEQNRLGEFDGDEIGEGAVTLFCYGPDAEKLFSGIEATLRGLRLCRGAKVVIRAGGPGSEERTVWL